LIYFTHYVFLLAFLQIIASSRKTSPKIRSRAINVINFIEKLKSLFLANLAPNIIPISSPQKDTLY